MSSNTKPAGFHVPDDPAPQTYPFTSAYPPPMESSYPSYPPQMPPQQGYPPSQAYPGGYPPPIQQQPASGGFQPPTMSSVAGMAGINPGVQQHSWLRNSTLGSYLVQATSFQVKQQKELLEILIGWETANRYVIKDNFGNKLFYAAEFNDCFTLNCLQSLRPFTMKIKDLYGNDVLQLDRPFRCCCPCFGSACCLQQLEVRAANGQIIGRVNEECSCLFKTLDICTPNDQVVLRVHAPLIPSSCFGQPVVFHMETVSGAKVGQITKEFGGIVRELFTNADRFSISFPVDLDINMKATALGALFLCDYMFFEDAKK